MPMNGKKGEKIVKPRISLYLEKEKTHAIDDMRLLMALNGRNMDSILEFTDIIDAIIYYIYRKTVPEVNETLLGQFMQGAHNVIQENKEETDLLNFLKSNEIEITRYHALTGYDAKIYILKDYYKDLIEKSILNINKKGDIIIEYPDFIKKSIDYIMRDEKTKLDFFTYIYVGNLYNFSPTMSLKIALFEPGDDFSYNEITYPELKQIKLLNSDSPVINELVKIITKIRKISNPGRQYDSLVSELQKKQGLLKSSLWNFNYVDAFYGLAYSYLYILGHFESLINFIENIDINDMVYKVLRDKVRDEGVNILDRKVKRTLTLLEIDLEIFVENLTNFLNLSQLALQFNINELTELKEYKIEALKKFVESKSFRFT